jgi:hypothetical protein
MFGPHWYHRCIEKNLTAFGSIFNSIEVIQYKADGTEEERITVPVGYGPKDQYLLRADEGVDLKGQVAITLPIIAFEMTGLSYDSTRSKNMMQQNTYDVDLTRKKLFTPAPYNFSITLSILAKREIDAHQIIEQILPWFRPSFKFTLKTIPELEIEDNVTVLLTSIDKEDNFEADWLERREIIYTLSFTLKTNLYGPVRDQGVIIETQVDTHLVAGKGLDGEITRQEIEESPRVERITATPEPPGATPETQTGTNIVKEEFNDGKKYNPVTDEDEDI